jgi:WD40 repeat protein
VLSVSLAPDGRHLLTTAADGTASVWDIPTGERVDLVGHTAAVVDGAFDADSERVVTAASDGTARVWQASDGRQVSVLAGHEGRLVISAAFDPTGRRVVTAGDDATARIWDTITGEELAVLRGHRDEVDAATFDPTGSRVATGSGDGTAKIWNAAGQTVAILSGHRGPAFPGAFIPPDRVATTGADETARVWDWRTGEQFFEMPGSFYAYLDEDEGHLVTIGDRDIGVWELATGALVRSAPHGASRSWTSAAFDPRTDLVLIGDADGTARIVDVTGTRDPVVLRHNETEVLVNAVGFAPDGSIAVTGGDDGVARAWSLPGGEPLLDYDGHDRVYDVEFSLDGRLLLTRGSQDEVSIVWDVATGRRLHVLQGNTAVAFGPDGRVAVTSDDDGAARIWDVATGEALAVLHPDAGVISEIEFSPDGELILTAENSGTAHVWDAATGAELLELAGHSGPLEGAIFDVTGTLVLTASDDGTARVFSCDVCVPLPELIELATSRLTRELSAEERAEFL